MVDVTHDRDHRRTRLQRLGCIDVLGRVDIDVGLTDALDAVAELGDEQLGRVLVDRLRQSNRRAHLEEGLDQVGATLGHAVCEFLNGDCLGDDHVPDLLGRRTGLHVVTLFLFASATERGERAGAALVFVGQGAADGELPRMAAIFATARRTRRLGALRRRRMARTAEAALLGFFGHRNSSRFCILRRRRCSCGKRLFLSSASGFLGGCLFGATILLGSATLFLVGRTLGLFLAAARILERGHAGFLRLAEKARLHFLAVRDLFGRGRPARLRSCRSNRLRRWCGRRRFGNGLGRRRRSFARLREDAPLLPLDDYRVRAAVAEALLDLAGLYRALDAQRGPGAKLRFFGLVCHSIPSSNLLQPRRGQRWVLHLQDLDRGQ